MAEKQREARVPTPSINAISSTLRVTAGAACPTQPKILAPQVFWEVRGQACRFCIDCIVTADEGILMGLRTSWPLKDKLCFIGGGVLLGDGRKFEDIAASKVESETGIVAAVRGAPIGSYSLIFKRARDDENGKAGSVTHDIVLPIVMDVKGGNLRTDMQHSKLVWLSRLNNDLHPYVSQALEDSGLFPNGSYNRNGSRPHQFVMRTQYSEE